MGVDLSQVSILAFSYPAAGISPSSKASTRD
jgi:hypothetical protein